MSDLRLEYFEAQHELARNFYDDYEFCPLPLVEEVREHRERIHRRTSPYSSPTHSPVRSYSLPSISKKAIPIIDPSNMTPVLIPSYQQHSYQQSNRHYYCDTTGSGAYYNDMSVNEPSAQSNNLMVPSSSFYSLTAY
ncbi:hypothetical protein K501DRAFT_262966 [Backusella circina FSU 941]|nr:hypothetical protein K501DRAFT_262966 [Backusella circina FSU 941]